MNIRQAKVAEIISLDTCRYDASIFVDQSFFIPTFSPNHAMPTAPAKPAVVVIRCDYCGVRQVPENVYECCKCGAPLS